MAATSLEKQRRGTPEAGQAKALKPRPAVSPANALPLEEIGELTHAFREGIAREHDRRAAEAATRADQSWDAIGRRAGLYAVCQGPKAGPRWAKKVTRDSATHVRRVRRGWRAWKTKKGQARRSRTVRVVHVPAFEAHRSTKRWREGRASGQRHRMATVDACGVGRLEVMCTGCGCVHESPVWCGVNRLCAGCNARRSAKQKARFAAALGVVTNNADKCGAFRPNRRGGALSEHHLVLTTPEPTIEAKWSPSGAWGWVSRERVGQARKATAAMRIELLFSAFKRFSRRLQAFFREPWEGWDDERRKVGVCWHRAFEWTPGRLPGHLGPDDPGGDGMGHPHFHMWLLSPWIPERDDHKIASIGAGGGRASTPCRAPHRVTGAWGWAETMRRERCELCVGGERNEKFFERYYRKCRRPEAPAVERRTGLRTWWVEALAAEGAIVSEQKAIVSLRSAYVAPRTLIQEVQKQNGISYTRRVVKALEVRSKATGELVDYFEGWTLDLVDQASLDHAGPEVIAGVFEALEGRRLSQSSKVTLRRTSGELVEVGFLGIADAMYDAGCGDCDGAARVAGAPAGEPPDRNVRIVSWSKVVAARFAASPATERGPPISEGESLSTETYEGIVRRLVAEERARVALERGTLRTLSEICELVRTEGDAVLPVYRRMGQRRGPRRPLTMRERMKREAKRRARK